jgi:hypothetical protein
MQKLNFLQTSTPLNVDGGQHVLLRSTSTSEDVGSMPPECRFTRPEMQDWRISTEKIKERSPRVRGEDDAEVKLLTYIYQERRDEGTHDNPPCVVFVWTRGCCRYLLISDAVGCC